MTYRQMTTDGKGRAHVHQAGEIDVLAGGKLERFQLDVELVVTGVLCLLHATIGHLWSHGAPEGNHYPQ